MASLVEDKQGNFLVAFRLAKQQFTRSLETREPEVALAAVARVEETIMRLKRGWLTMPDGAEPGAFITSGGTMTEKPGFEVPKVSKALTLSGIFAVYEEQLTPNCKEANSLDTEKIHKRHLFRIMGEDQEFQKIDLEVVQKYVNARAKEGVSRDTIRKELATLRMLWNWAKRLKIAPPSWEMKELTFSKAEQKEVFQTWAQIERRVAGRRLSPERSKALWESLYLDGKQIQECLAHVRDHASHPFIHPMFVFCACTGARRSELLRSERDDFDFVGLRVAIRQKKHDSSKTFTIRHVPILPELAAVMKDWFTRHPGGRYTITSHGRDEEMLPRMATKYFRGVLAGSKWSVLHGFHVFRHSLASIMATQGEDQRVINGVLGHSTEDMERRYRHLFPHKGEQAITRLFAGV